MNSVVFATIFTIIIWGVIIPIGKFLFTNAVTGFSFKEVIRQIKK